MLTFTPQDHSKSGFKLARVLSLAHLFDRDPDDIGRDDLDNVKLQQPPDEDLQLLHIIQELQEKHREAFNHQMPFTLQLCTKRLEDYASN